MIVFTSRLVNYDFFCSIKVKKVVHRSFDSPIEGHTTLIRPGLNADAR